MTYCTHIGPKTGPIMWWAGYHAIGVPEARGAAVPGPWIVVDREFRPAE
jgi:hypothetical protein